MLRLRRTTTPLVKAVLKRPAVVQFVRRDFSQVAVLQRVLMNVPKGFEKFYRNPNSKSDSKQPPNNSKSDGKKENGGGGGGGKPNKKPDDYDNLVKAMIIAGLLFFVLSSFEVSVKEGREISWQDFQKQLLESGQVDRIVVTNKNIAKVFLRPPVERPKDNNVDFNADNFSWPADGPVDHRPHDMMTAPAQTEQPKFGRYSGSIGTPNHINTPSYYFNIGTVDSFERKLEEAQKSLGIAPRDFVPVIYVNETHWSSELMKFLPTIVLIGLMVALSRGLGGGAGSGGPGNIFRIGKSTAKKINKENVKTTFADVAGCDEAKREIMEFVQFLKDPKRFTDLGAKIPKGALLCGPPGTGKTLLAKATAGEANVPFFSISGSDFVEMFVGVGPSRVRDLFKEARENAPCIIFIDEIDAVGRQRGRGGFSGGNDERENTLNQMLVEMDGFDSTANIVVLAGTNRVDILDAALTRPGRFDRQITVDKPDIKGRKAIFEIYLKNLQLSDKIENYSSRLAGLTPGFVGADIANICNEAAIIAARRSKKQIDMEDFEAATDRIIGGLESRKIMTPEEKRVVAYHEAGHAVAGWFMEHTDPLLKVTIVPRSSGALGFAQYLPKELFLRTKDQILDMVCMALAGRAAEQVTFGRVTTGAADDLRRVTQIVYQMVQVYGMNEKIGQVAFPKEDGAWPQDRLYSNATAEKIDEEVRAIVDEAYKRTLRLMEEKKEQVKLVAELLMQKETITNGDIAELIGARPHSSGKEYEEYLNIGWKNKADVKEEAPKDERKHEKESNLETDLPDNLSPA